MMLLLFLQIFKHYLVTSPSAFDLPMVTMQNTNILLLLLKYNIFYSFFFKNIFLHFCDIIF